MEMLTTTQDFKEFNGFVDDSGGEVRHIEGSMKRKADKPSNAQNHGRQNQSG